MGACAESHSTPVKEVIHTEPEVVVAETKVLTKELRKRDKALLIVCVAAVTVFVFSAFSGVSISEDAGKIADVKVSASSIPKAAPESATRFIDELRQEAENLAEGFKHMNMINSTLSLTPAIMQPLVSTAASTAVVPYTKESILDQFAQMPSKKQSARSPNAETSVNREGDHPDKRHRVKAKIERSWKGKEKPLVHRIQKAARNALHVPSRVITRAAKRLTALMTLIDELHSNAGREITATV
jgi:hypothetical protein